MRHRLKGGIKMESGKISVGVSTSCGYPEVPEKTLASLCEKGVRRLEIFVNTHSETDPGYIRELAGILRANGSECVSLHPFTCGIDTYMLYTGYERRIRDYLEYHKRYFEAMNILGAKYFILHGNKNPCPIETVVDGYARLNEVASGFGVTVLQENVCRCTTGELSELLEMKRILGDGVSFVLDTKQAIRKGLDPYDFIPALGKSIKHVHFSDHGAKGDCLLPGMGDIDTHRFVRALGSVGFSGTIMLELYRSGFNSYDDLVKSMKFIQSVIDSEHA